MEKGFKWNGWVEPMNQYEGGYHVTGLNKNGIFEHFHQDKDGNKTECDCKSYSEEEAKALGFD